MYEVELKVELSVEEKDKLIESFREKGFSSKGITPQNDYYIEAKESPYGGFDLKRYRNEDGKFIYTEKIWEQSEDQLARKENEHEVSEDEFKAKITEFPDAITVKKDRAWFGGTFEGVSISITIDSVKFDHSPCMRYFMEAEIDVKDKKEVAKTKELIRSFLKEILDKSEIVEAPGMFSMALKKL